MPAGRYDERQIADLTQSALKDRFCILRDPFPRMTLEKWRAAFTPLLDAHVAREGHLFNRARHLLRFNPVVDSLDEQPETEVYQSFAY